MYKKTLQITDFPNDKLKYLYSGFENLLRFVSIIRIKPWNPSINKYIDSNFIIKENLYTNSSTKSYLVRIL